MKKIVTAAKALAFFSYSLLSAGCVLSIVRGDIFVPSAMIIFFALAAYGLIRNKIYSFQIAFLVNLALALFFLIIILIPSLGENFEKSTKVNALLMLLAFAAAILCLLSSRKFFLEKSRASSER